MLVPMEPVAAPLQRPGAAFAGNAILAGVSARDRAALEPHLVPTAFAMGNVIARAGEPIRSVCFLEEGIAGVLDVVGETRPYAVGLVGAEGFIGWPLVLGDDRSAYDVVMRAERARALLLPADVLLAAIGASDALRATCLRYVHTLMMQMGRTIGSALTQTIERRMARWILLYHDRVGDDDICMSHEEFSLMLGVRRSSITDALHRLEEERAIQSFRGRVVVRDRAKLRMLAGETYGFAEREYGRLLKTPGLE